MDFHSFFFGTVSSEGNLLESCVQFLEVVQVAVQNEDGSRRRRQEVRD